MWEFHAKSQIGIFVLGAGLYHNPQHPQRDWQDDVEITQWLELLRSFTAVNNLYLSEEFAPRIVSPGKSSSGGE
jgi:hypothetical protein